MNFVSRNPRKWVDDVYLKTNETGWLVVQKPEDGFCTEDVKLLEKKNVYDDGVFDFNEKRDNPFSEIVSEKCEVPEVTKKNVEKVCNKCKMARPGKHEKFVTIEQLDRKLDQFGSAVMKSLLVCAQAQKVNGKN